jgi:HEAT repeat protein
VNVRQPVLAIPLIAAILAAAPLLHAQSKSTPAPEAGQLAAGWTALSQGEAARAATLANQALGQNPRSGAALGLLVAARTVGGGWTEGLTAYEQGLGNRRLDDAYTLRIVALALLREAAHDAKAPDGQREAVKALTAEGDTDTLLLVAKNAKAGGPFETQLLAQMGSEAAVEKIVAELKSGEGHRLTLIQALSNTHSALAVPPLVELLKEHAPEVRTAAADALGKIGDPSAVPALRPLMNDPVFSVKFAAAAALTRLHDTSGLPFLAELQVSEHAMIRVTALEALAGDPDAAWQASVTGLLHDPDPQVRLAAARLAAPYDPLAVQTVLEGLMSDPNLAIRQAASKVFVEQVASDFSALRRLLHSGDLVTRVRAAGRILSLTR